MLAAYGSGAGALLVLAGPRAGATLPSLIAVNGVALASLGSGAWYAMALARRPPPLPADTTDWHALTADTALAQLASTWQGLLLRRPSAGAPCGQPARSMRNPAWSAPRSTSLRTR